MVDFLMPSLGSDMEAGTLLEWLVKPGDPVHRGAVVAVVETVKGAIDIEIFVDGVVGALLVEPGTEVPVGAALARVDQVNVSAAASAPVSPAEAPASGRGDHRVGAGRVAVSPAARRRAAELGVNSATLTGSGAGGVVTLADVELAGRSRSKSGPEPTRSATRIAADLAAMRDAIAAAMARSKREIPHYYLTTTADMRTAVDWLTQTNAGRAPAERLLLAVLLIKATTRAVCEFPEFSGFYLQERFQHSEGTHVGMAIALRGGGLVAPAVRHAGDRGVDDLMAAFRDLVQRARTGRLRSSELSDPTITVSSLGECGVETLLPVIYPPQVAIVGFGAVVERPWVIDGEVIPRPLINISLAADHRVSDGRRGGQFLAAISDGLQRPEAWLNAVQPTGS